MALVLSKTYNIKTAGFSIMAEGRTAFRNFFIRDGYDRERIENLENHIAADDYFGSLATIIDLMGQELENADPLFRETLNNLKNDLLYLQDNYGIVKK